ncbi:membrane protein [Enterococcus canis]|jgi:Predicted membrane protein|uniref:Membrane protein n=1 Tax=Enterococcus canis TaxID=214095 RepID=A0A1L8RFW6_9ENTE|nr:ECF transporter S component [Enterococcus canis]OJG18627.1 membrane protein [Enterococcus canis]
MKNTRTFTLTAMFLGILLLLAFTPLGFIPIGPINATTMHIPVIIASIILGPKIGGFLGGTFGIISIIRATIFPNATSFVFSPFIPVIGTNSGDLRSLIVAIVPRILIGIVPYYAFKLLNHWFKAKGQPASLFIAGLLGSITNTILVMNLIFFLFRDAYAQATGTGVDVLYGAILGIIFTAGIPEAIVAGLATAGVAAVLLRLMRKNPTQL